MHIMLTVTYPPDKAVEVSRIALKNQQENPLSSFIKTVGTFVTSSLESGVKVVVIYEIDAGKEDDGRKEIAKGVVQLFSVEGLRYSSETVLTAEEATALLPL